MASPPFSRYRSVIERDLESGNATEHTHRPALKTLIEQLAPDLIATNEPKRVACGAPDFVVSRNARHNRLTVGYIEAKDVGEPLNRVERSEQMKRYMAALPNLILTDYLEFRWYVEGARRQTARLAEWRRDKLVTDRAGSEAVTQLLHSFLSREPQPIMRARDLAVRMARLTHMVRDIIIAAFETDEASELLRGWRSAFAQVLIADLDQPEKTAEFADMFAQTLAYGLFSARVMDTTPGFTRQEAQRLIPKSNPFLRQFFGEISGVRMDDEPYAGFVDDLVALLERSDMAAVLSDFGKRKRHEDPIVHFYETFLAAYDPELREARGVYYTPEPVVSYIVRSVDHLIKSRFSCPAGLADNSMVRVANPDPSLKVRGKRETRKTTHSHKVLLLDPACGTGTFLYAVVDHIRDQFMEQGNAGLWPGYVSDHLLPRLFGFELLMAPYAMAHFKLGLQLAARDLPDDQRAAWGSDLGEGTRVGVYLTNTLEGPHEWTGLPLFTQFLADETRAANRVKQDLPIMVVLGNPPYSGHSANKGSWIQGLVRDYYWVDGHPLRERNPKWLQDDYVKFIRFAQWRIERSGSGILAFISNNGYLDNPTFRGMRQHLMRTFDDIYILDLHGSSKKRERASDGGRDENVFDIQQGVAIGIFVRGANRDETKLARVHHADLWGTREDKYAWLTAHDPSTTESTTLAPQSPFYLFTPQDVTLKAEYEQHWSTTAALPVNVLGFQTHRDHFAIAFDQESTRARISDLRNPVLTDAELRNRYGLSDNRDWQLARARKQVQADSDWERYITRCLYRPFDWRACYFSTVAMDYPRGELMCHVLGKDNYVLGLGRQGAAVGEDVWSLVAASRDPVDANIFRRGGINLFPLYLYPANEEIRGTRPMPLLPEQHSRRPNLDPQFIADAAGRVGLTFISDGGGDLQQTFGPEDVFHYIYGILHSPTYRRRYAEFLKGDFPRLPLTSDLRLFRHLCDLGRELTDLHLMDKGSLPMVSFPVRGDNAVEAVRYTEPGCSADEGRV